MKRFRVFSLNRSNSNIPNEIILSIGGINSNGTFWRITQATAIEGILNNKWKFYVLYNGSEIDVVVGLFNNQNYLKGSIDDKIPMVLLSLPESI
jgi:hypothetical protein